MSTRRSLVSSLWNLVVERLLVESNDLGFSTFGNADDIVIIVQRKFAHTVRELMQGTLDVVVNWAVKEDLNISPHKTTKFLLPIEGKWRT
jgi:hypothetical protein